MLIKREEERGSSSEILQLLQNEKNNSYVMITNQQSHISK